MKISLTVTALTWILSELISVSADYCGQSPQVGNVSACVAKTGNLISTQLYSQDDDTVMYVTAAYFDGTGQTQQSTSQYFPRVNQLTTAVVTNGII